MTKLTNTLKNFGLNFFFSMMLVLISAAAANAQVKNTEFSDLREYDLNGTWIVTIDAGPAGTFKGLHTYNQGGGMIETNQTDMQPPKQTTGQGSWEKLSRNRYGFTFVSFQYDENGVAVSTLKVRGKVRLIGRDRFIGESEVLICDANVEDCFSVGTSTDDAVRLGVEEPDFSRKP
jgi:hypothetical protein